MFKKILAPVDLDEPSTASVQYAGFFARQFGSEVVLMYADEIASLFGGFDAEFVGYHIPSGEQTAGQEHALRKLAVRHLNGIRVPSTIAVPGPPVASIVRVAGEVNADLIVLGNHDRTGWRRTLSSSVAAGVVREAGQAVLVTPSSSYPEDVRRVICPVNFSAASRDALDYAVRIAKAFEAELLLVHVHEADGIDSEAVHDRFRSHVPD